MFDVEVSVKTDPRAVMAVLLTDQAWYTWLSPYFLYENRFPAAYTPDTMIPLGWESTPRLMIGHNVSYDRIRVGEEYFINRFGMFIG